MSDFISVALLSDFSESNKLCLEVDDRFVILVRVQDKIYCVDDECTHDGGPLGEGALEDLCLICPRHGAKFDVRTGKALTMPATEPTASHEVKMVDGQIFVKLADD
ncbi:MAG: non-heme iron oxygenase ferredoxin subunit [Planctomycetota bacterium]|nr:non-heme iron oxygenase ferredoxin subunit [Planctomycetota bacterium]